MHICIDNMYIHENTYICMYIFKTVNYFPPATFATTAIEIFTIVQTQAN